MAAVSDNKARSSMNSVRVYKSPAPPSQSCLPLHVELIIAPSSQPIRIKQNRTQRGPKMVPNFTNVPCPSRTPAACRYPGCGKVLANRTVLKRHMISHSNVYPFSCDFPGCTRRCRTRTHMRSHRMLHLDPSERPRFYCPLPGCSKHFSHSSSLRAHKRTHQNIWPYKCSHPGCVRRFRSRGHLNDHRNIHLEKKARPAVVCPEPDCGKIFYWTGSLKRHMFIHTGDWPYWCDFPGCTFKTAVERKLKLHALSHSKNKRPKQKSAVSAQSRSKSTRSVRGRPRSKTTARTRIKSNSSDRSTSPSMSESEISVGSADSTDVVLKPRSIIKLDDC